MLLCVTANHLNSSFGVLERLSALGESVALDIRRADSSVDGAVVLSTCNRFEAYLEVSEESTTHALEGTLRVLEAASGIDAESLGATFSVFTGERVAEHLFAVSSGLESVAVGETEIAGQVGRALENARASGTTSPGIERLFQRATHTSREVKGHTELGGSSRSVLGLAIELAESRIEDWASTRLLVIGTGRYASATVGALHARGIRDVRVFSPSGRAVSFAVQHGIIATTSLLDAITESDVVIACTTTLALDPSAIPDESRRLLIDLGLPRNIAPEVGSLPGIELLDLETIRLHAPLSEFASLPAARAIVRAAAAQLIADQAVEAGIVSLRAHVFELLEHELARARSRGDSSAETEAALRHLTGVLLHGPSTRARELAREGRASEFLTGLSALFDIEASTAIGRDGSVVAFSDDDSLALG